MPRPTTAGDAASSYEIDHELNGPSTSSSANVMQQLLQLHSKFNALADFKTEFDAVSEALQREMTALSDLVNSQRREVLIAKKEAAKKAEENARLRRLRKPAEVAGNDTLLRTVVITRRDGLLGMNCYGTSIDEVTKGGPAALQGVNRGDQLILVDGVNVETLSHDAITKLLGDGGDKGEKKKEKRKKKEKKETVTLVVRFNPERLYDIEANWD